MLHGRRMLDTGCDLKKNHSVHLEMENRATMTNANAEALTQLELVYSPLSIRLNLLW